MSADGSRRVLWYTRRNNVARGPYPDRQISRYILLGRIRETDELKPEGGEWALVRDYPELIPEIMKLPPSEETSQLLLMAQMREDERAPGDRRDRETDVPQSVKERRSGQERRQAETDNALRHRDLKYRVAHAAHANGKLYRYPLIFTMMVLAGFAISFMLEKVEPDVAPPDCSARPHPGVDWSHCNLSGVKLEDANLVGARLGNARLELARLSRANLSGASLEYARFDLANLEQSNLSHANLFGATLRGANLRAARLTETNLSYANLSGATIEAADLSGAVLDNAIWIDERTCLPGSRGRCLFKKQ
ncbi:pentapeptide repeat protein [Thiogranum longum]|uniref:Pentapeptide repeat protein n=1 Tax=Thiogranum longum TaxID=1537524 RepID=A0A4R1HDU4_9GAMM|nr:pentapeptide repeat-containing protein [Thiogranum longum]TCK18813.1 pentapeptide repeat protein [Thiogranum longum]